MSVAKPLFNRAQIFETEYSVSLTPFFSNIRAIIAIFTLLTNQVESLVIERKRDSAE